MVFIPDETAAFNALLSGDVDADYQVAGDGLERLGSIGDEGFRVVSVPAPGIRYAVLNGGDERFADERVRQAIGHAINRQPIIDGPVSGYGEPTCVFANPPNVLWASDYCPYPYDPDRARELLAEAGADGLTLEITGLTSGTFPLTTEILAAQLTDIGVSVEVLPVDAPTWLEDVPAGNYEFTHIGGSQPFDVFKCPGSFAHDCVEEVDRLLDEADATVDTQSWADLRREAIELHAERGYVIPLYTFPTLRVLPEGLVGEKGYSHAGEFDLRSLRWEG
jgi:peptide/nickel transport system substrate-binding protein